MSVHSGIFKNLIENTTYFIKKTPGITLTPAPRNLAFGGGIKIINIPNRKHETKGFHNNLLHCGRSRRCHCGDELCCSRGDAPKEASLRLPCRCGRHVG